MINRYLLLSQSMTSEQFTCQGLWGMLYFVRGCTARVGSNLICAGTTGSFLYSVDTRPID